MLKSLEPIVITTEPVAGSYTALVGVYFLPLLFSNLDISSKEAFDLSIAIELSPMNKAALSFK